jgi:hypothetical protein
MRFGGTVTLQTPSRDAGDRGVRRWRLVVACAAGAEAAVLAAATVFALVVTLSGHGANVPRGLLLALLSALAAGGMTAVTIGLYRGRRWSRAPAATWQLLQASIAVPALGIGAAATALGGVLLVLCAVVLAGVLQARLFADLTPPR